MLTYFVDKPQGNRLFGRSRCRWTDNIKIDLKVIWYDNVHWIYLAQDAALVNTAMNLWVP
jgi:hypothetical protein